MIVVHTNAPMLPLTQMVQGDAMIRIPVDSSDVLAVVTDDEEVAHWVAYTLNTLGYHVAIEDNEGASVRH